MKTVQVQIDYTTCPDGRWFTAAVDTRCPYDSNQDPIWYFSRALSYFIPSLNELGIPVGQVFFHFVSSYYNDENGIRHHII